MPEPDDHQLLADFVRNESEPAFAALVGRYVNLVYSTALRSTGNPHHAEEITQAVFIILARKAATLSPRVVLSGWLYQAARLTSANLLKSETRRRRREQEVYMQSTLSEPTETTWKELAPLLDDAMGGLGQTDRDAVVLRFFENKSAAEIGAALRMNEETARRRVNRAVEKLRKYFAKRGVVSSVAAIEEKISANSVQTAPLALAKSVSAVATAKGSIAAASTMTLVKGTMKTMTWLKMRFAAGMGATVLLGVATVAISQTAGDARLTAQEIARQSEDAYAALSSYSDTGTVTASVDGRETQTTTFNIRLQRSDLYRLEWSSTAGVNKSTGAAWSDGDGNFFEMNASGRNAKPEKVSSMQQTFASVMGVSSSAASIPATFFKQPYGDLLAIPAAGRFQLKRMTDEKIGETDCFVIFSALPSVKLPNNRGNSGVSTTTLWIGKSDHLIHQVETTLEGASIIPPPLSDATLKTLLERQNKPATAEAIANLRAEQEKSLKAAQGAKYVFMQTHENISVNEKFPVSDFQAAP